MNEANFPEEFRSDFVFAREVLARGLTSLETINQALQERSQKNEKRSLGQILLHSRALAIEQFIEITRELSSLSAADQLARHPEGPALAIHQEGETVVLTQKSGFQTIGRYRILREIARGGMGVVYAAEDTDLGRMVALKTMLHTGDEAGDTETERFLREAQLAGWPIRALSRSMKSVFTRESIFLPWTMSRDCRSRNMPRKPGFPWQKCYASSAT